MSELAGLAIRGQMYRAKLADAFPDVTWTYAPREVAYSHLFTGEFPLFDGNVTLTVEVSDEMLEKHDFEQEMVHYVAQSIAQGVTKYVLGRVRYAKA